MFFACCLHDGVFFILFASSSIQPSIHPLPFNRELARSCQSHWSVFWYSAAAAARGLQSITKISFRSTAEGHWLSSYPRKGSEQDEEEIPIVTVALVLLLVRFAIVSITPVTVCRSEHKEQEKRMMEVFPATSQPAAGRRR